MRWRAVVDLANFLFHLGLEPSSGRCFRIKTAMGDSQWTALPLGQHASPYRTERMAQVVGETLRRQGVHLMWYIDDILILGEYLGTMQKHPNFSASHAQMQDLLSTRNCQN